MTFHTILFDLDDTLHDRNRSLSAFVGLFRKKYAHALECEDSGFEAVFKELDGSGYRPRKEMFKELLDRTSWRAAPEINELIDYWNKVFPLCAEPMPKVYDILDYLQSKEIKMGIVTNSSVDFQNRKIDKLNLRKYMHTIIISEEVGLSKPDPGIFRLAMAAVGSSPDSTLFVGDYPPTDIKGAYDTGLASVWISNGKAWAMEDYKPTYTIHCLPEIIRAVGL